MRTKRTRVIGIVVPIHNEEEQLDACLRALSATIASLPVTIDCRVALVLDSCADTSAAIADRWIRTHTGVLIRCQASNVGAARKAGCSALLRSLPPIRPRHLWLATTDADSQVPRRWLEAQVAAHEAGVNLWTGRVTVNDWSGHHPSTAQRWTAAYANEIAPVHGTSMGINGQVYLDIGGFNTFSTGEDRDLYFRAISAGASAHHDQTARVLTSARQVARAPLGFADALTKIERDHTDGLRTGA